MYNVQVLVPLQQYLVWHICWLCHPLSRRTWYNTCLYCTGGTSTVHYVIIRHGRTLSNVQGRHRYRVPGTSCSLITSTYLVLVQVLLYKGVMRCDKEYSTITSTGVRCLSSKFRYR